MVSSLVAARSELAGYLDAHRSDSGSRIWQSSLPFGSAALVGAGADGITFTSSVDLVRVSAVVRDRKGRFVQDLSAHDFEVLDGGQPRPITDFRHDAAGVSVALLFDVSGSMEGTLPDAREAAMHVLSWLEPTATRRRSSPSTRGSTRSRRSRSGLKTLPARCRRSRRSARPRCTTRSRRPAERVGDPRRPPPRRRRVHRRQRQREPADAQPRCRRSPAAIDVPVYIIGIVPSIDNPSAEYSTNRRAVRRSPGPLADLAAWTGGRVFVASTPAQRSVAARQIVDELRHQYLIAFESSGKPGWHPLVVRARNKDLIVRARSGYIAGQSRPNSDVGGSIMFRKFFMAVPVAAFWRSAARPPAPRKKFVRTSVGEVNDKVDSLGRSVEETQERTRQNEGRITEVDQKAQAAAQSAQQANQAPAQRRSATRGRRVGTQGATRRSTRSTRPVARLVYEVVLSEDQGNFKFGQTTLPDEAKQRIDADDPAAEAGSEERLHRDRRTHRQRRRQGRQREARPRARRGGEALSLRAVPDSAAQDERDQLRRGEAGRAEQDQGRAARRIAASSSRCWRDASKAEVRRKRLEGSRQIRLALTSSSFVSL